MRAVVDTQVGWPSRVSAQWPSYVYVASSWRCERQPLVIDLLRGVGVDCYDFRNPEAGTGFGWSEVMPGFDRERQLANIGEYLDALDHERSREGFDSDFNAMLRADTFVLLLPCGRSAHLEAGWAKGADKRLAIVLDPDAAGDVTPELMYRMADLVTPSVGDLLRWLGVGQVTDTAGGA